MLEKPSSANPVADTAPFGATFDHHPNCFVPVWATDAAVIGKRFRRPTERTPSNFPMGLPAGRSFVRSLFFFFNRMRPPPLRCFRTCRAGIFHAAAPEKGRPGAAL